MIPACSFCDKRRDQVKHLIARETNAAGRTVSEPPCICDECIGKALEQLFVAGARTFANGLASVRLASRIDSDVCGNASPKPLIGPVALCVLPARHQGPHSDNSGPPPMLWTHPEPTPDTERNT